LLVAWQEGDEKMMRFRIQRRLFSRKTRSTKNQRGFYYSLCIAVVVVKNEPQLKALNVQTYHAHVKDAMRRQSSFIPFSYIPRKKKPFYFELAFTIYMCYAQESNATIYLIRALAVTTLQYKSATKVASCLCWSKRRNETI
jgi:hypothetical protein